MKIAIGGDHAGFELKEQLNEWLHDLGHPVKDFGPFAVDSVDYADFAHPLSNDVAKGNCDMGILICGSANGVAMTANKHPNIRAAICWTEEIAVLAKTHNNANIICLPARFITVEQAKAIVKAHFDNEFQAGRHERRINKIPCI